MKEIDSTDGLNVADYSLSTYEGLSDEKFIEFLKDILYKN